MGIEGMLHHFFFVLFKIDFFFLFLLCFYLFFYSFWTFTNIFNRSHKLNERKIYFFHICKLHRKKNLYFILVTRISYTALCTLFVASEKSTSKFGSRLKKSEREVFFLLFLENYTESMKWNMPFVESRTFDTRLTKSALLPSYGTNATNKFQRPDYRQFKSNYPKESFLCLFLH